MKKCFTLLFIVFLSSHLFAQSMQQKMDSVLNAYFTSGKFNGAVLVGQKGNVIYQKAFGYKDGEKKIPNDLNTIFQIGSVTKQFTAAVIMQLQQEGKLSVKDKLSKYFPEIVNADKITLENLLTHTSGIYNYTNDTVLMRSDITKSYSQKQMLEIFKKYPADFEPGAKWNYSNTGYSLLGYIIEKVTKKPYEKVVRERILQPLGMTNSGFDFTHLKNNDKARGYFVLSDDQTIPAPIVDSTIAYSAGALFSTVNDLYKWEQAISTDKILNQQSWKSVFTPFQNKYGYGWGMDSLYGRLVTAHSGGIHGFASYILRLPQDEVAVIIMDNASGTNLSRISSSLAAIVLNKPFNVPAAKKEIQVSESILKQYVGEYQLAPAFTITVRIKDGKLVAQATGQQEFDLFAETENKFFLKAVEAQVEFVKDESGNVTEMILYQNGLKPRGKKIK